MRLQAREARDRLAPSGDYNVFACRRLLYKLRQLGFSLVRLGGILSIVPARCASQSEMSLIWACLDSNQGPRDYESSTLTYNPMNMRTCEDGCLRPPKFCRCSEYFWQLFWTRHGQLRISGLPSLHVVPRVSSTAGRFVTRRADAFRIRPCTATHDGPLPGSELS
jgi:hypothetical protein